MKVAHCDINIGSMQVSRLKPRGQALMVIILSIPDVSTRLKW